MKPKLLASDEVEDFWAMNVSIEAAFVPDAELARAIAERRVQRAVCASSMGTAETYWYALPATTPIATARENGAVVPPGQEAETTPYEDWADDRDVDTVLWAPFRRGQIMRLAGAMPVERAPIAIAELERVHAALDARYKKQLRPRDRGADLEGWISAVMRRIGEFSPERIDSRVLRFEVLRTLVQIAWNRPWQPVDVNAAWWD